MRRHERHDGIGPVDVAFVTCGAMPGLHSDDRYLLRALREAGLSAEPVVWEDPHQDWAAARLCVIRSTWDYCWRRGEFVSWAERAAEHTSLWNSAAVVRWNTHKRYLCDLSERGVPTVPTALLPKGSQVNLAQMLHACGWSTTVTKAAVAQSGRYAMLVPPERRREGQAHLDRLLPHEDMLVQAFVPSVPERGELSLTYVEGEFTHAVRKKAPPGDFRVHDDYGGSVTPEEPTGEQVAAGLRALQAVGEPTLYARVDLVDGPAGEPLIMEFELVEPELFFRFSSEAVARLVNAIVGRLKE